MSIAEGLDVLAARVGSGDFGTAPEWGASEVMITAGSPDDRMDEFSRFSDPVVVQTPHARELSWLFGEVRAVFAAGRVELAGAGGAGSVGSGVGGSAAGGTGGSGSRGSGAWLGGGGAGVGAESVTSAASAAADAPATDAKLFAAMAGQVNRVLKANPEACKKTQCMSALQYAYYMAALLEG